jgi:hypothetical protein
LSGCECRDVAGGHLLGVGGGVGDGGQSGAFEDLEAEVAAAFGPLVVLLGQHGSDQADQGVAVGEDADRVGAPADLSVESLKNSKRTARGYRNFSHYDWGYRLRYGI